MSEFKLISEAGGSLYRQVGIFTGKFRGRDERLLGGIPRIVGRSTIDRMRLKPILFFLAVGGLAVYVAAHQYQNGDGGVIRIGQMAPDFTVHSVDGKTANLSDYRGKLVFLNFWASWCEPCASEMPDLEVLNKTYKNRNFQMLTFSVDTDQDAAIKFYKKFNLTMPWFPDPGQQVAGKYKVSGFPETFLIDQNGHIVKHYIGAINTQIMAQLDTYIGEHRGSDGPTE